MRRECHRLLIRRVVRKILITGAPWRIRAAGGSLAGDKDTIMPDFTCRSFSTAASGDKRLYSGACITHPTTSPSSNGHRSTNEQACAHTLDP
jgi:hypothetical protein